LRSPDHSLLVGSADARRRDTGRVADATLRTRRPHNGGSTGVTLYPRCSAEESVNPCSDLAHGHRSLRAADVDQGDLRAAEPLRGPLPTDNQHQAPHGVVEIGHELPGPLFGPLAGTHAAYHRLRFEKVALWKQSYRMPIPSGAAGRHRLSAQREARESRAGVNTEASGSGPFGQGPPYSMRRRHQQMSRAGSI